MNKHTVDIAIIGAGPVGLMCCYLANLCGLSTIIIDKSNAPLQVGRADALNARTLQLLEIVDLFDELYPLGKTCNTSSIWADGKFLSRQSSWWEALEGCFHKHFLMLGQSFVEQLLDKKLTELGASVLRTTSVENIELNNTGCLTTLNNGASIQSRFVIGADGSKSFVRNHFGVPFDIIRPQITWAVVDGVLATDFPKVTEIIVFQAETSDVAWIPREGNIDRFYVRMDTTDFTLDEAVAKINRAMQPHTLSFLEVVWFSQFSVKESVAEKFVIEDRVFLAGDASHIHSVNGGQGLNTGLADAFNLIWKLHTAIRHKAPARLLRSYEDERLPVARSVIESSGELVRSTKYSATGTHAQDYLKIVEKRAGNITGMGIRYGSSGAVGSRIFDFHIYENDKSTRLYSLLDYSKFSLLVFSDTALNSIPIPDHINLIQIASQKTTTTYWTPAIDYAERVILIRPDAYIHSTSTVDNLNEFIAALDIGQPTNDH